MGEAKLKGSFEERKKLSELKLNSMDLELLSEIDGLKALDNLSMDAGVTIRKFIKIMPTQFIFIHYENASSVLAFLYRFKVIKDELQSEIFMIHTRNPLFLNLKPIKKVINKYIYENSDIWKIN